MKPFGAQTVTFIELTESGEPDELGMYPIVETETDVTGCHHRPLTIEETAQFITQITTRAFRTTAPPVAAALAASSTGQLRVAGETYRIIAGAKIYTDTKTDKPFKVTIDSEIRAG